MDVKLAEYRARKRREATVQKAKASFSKLFSFMLENKEKVDEVTEHSVDISDDNSCDVSENGSVTEEICDSFNWSKFLVYGILWLTLYIIALYAQFGAVYFAVSTLYILWRNTRTGPKQRGEISAYSVFNPECKRIDGTISAEQFENEIRYGLLHT